MCVNIYVWFLLSHAFLGALKLLPTSSNLTPCYYWFGLIGTIQRQRPVPVCSVSIDVQTTIIALIWSWRKLKDVGILMQMEVVFFSNGVYVHHLRVFRN